MKKQFMNRFAVLVSFIIVFSLYLPSLVAPSNPPTCSDCNIIIILVDTLRADHLGCYGYTQNTSPNIDALARQSIQFNHAFSAAPWTSASVASLFTSFYPSAHGITALSERGSETISSILSMDFLTLAEVLRQNGYATYAVTANGWITPRLGFSQGFTVFKELAYTDGGDAENITGIAIELLDSANHSQPFFMYLHYMDSHMPYEPLPEFDIFNDSLGGYSSEYQTKINAYDGEILYLDGKLGEFFTYLKERKIYDDTVILFVADHGEQFGEHSEEGHGKSVYNVETQVPLLIKSNGVRVERNDIASLIDVYPTILDIVGADFNHTIQGATLLTENERGAFSEITYLTDEQKSFVRSDGKKLILSYNTTDKLVNQADEARLEVYDVKTDRREEKKIGDDTLLDDLYSRLYAAYDETLNHRKNITIEETQLSENTIARLKALGYLN